MGDGCRSVRRCLAFDGAVVTLLIDVSERQIPEESRLSSRVAIGTRGSLSTGRNIGHEAG